MSLYRRGDVWWSRIEFDGTVHQFSTKKRNKNEARGVESQRRNELATGVGVAPTLEVFSQRFKNSLPARVSKDTLQFYTAHMQPLLDYPAMAACPLDRINAALVENFVQHRRKTVGTVTVNHNLRTLRRMLHLAQDWDVIARVPKLKLLTGENQREYVLTDEIIEKFAADRTRIGKIVPFLCDTGLRRSELCNLTWTAVNLPLHSIEVLKSKTKAGRRRIPLTSRAEKILTDILTVKKLIEQDLPEEKKCRYVFTTLRGPMTRDWLSHSFRRARKLLGLPDACVLHSTRHTFCTRLGERGADAFAIQKLAGHSSIVISQRYVHAQGPRLNTAIGLLEPAQSSA
jgi:integrase